MPIGYSLSREVVVPPQHLPDGEVMAVLRDAQGLPFAAFSPGT